MFYKREQVLTMLSEEDHKAKKYYFKILAIGRAVFVCESGATNSKRNEKLKIQ